MNRISFFALLGAPLLLVSGAARAQNSAVPTEIVPQKAAPAFKPAPLFAPSQISLNTLKNGVRGIVKMAPGTDLVNIQVWVRAGSRFETDRESGAAHVVELLALRGSKNFPAATGGDDDGGALGAIRALGGDGGSLTSRDSTFYSATVAAPYAARAVQILADATLRPDLGGSAIEDAKIQAADDIARRAFDPIASASDLAYASAFSKHPYRRAALGSDGSVAALSAPTVRAFYQKNYVGQNIRVVIVGQIAAGDAQKLIAQNFGAASAKPALSPKIEAETPLKVDVVARRRPVSREVINLAWRSAGITSPADCVALDTLLALWAEGLDANLRRILLRDGEKGPLLPLVSSYDVDYLTQRDAGLFIVSLVDATDREAAVQAVLEELRRVRDKGISPAELGRAKSQLRNQYLEQGESVAGQAGSLGFYDTISSHRFAVEYLDLCARVTSADVQRVANKYLSPDKYVRAEIAPLPRPRSEDDEKGPVITARLESAKMEVTQ